jgi:hypothetical protein
MMINEQNTLFGDRQPLTNQTFDPEFFTYSEFQMTASEKYAMLKA